ncbi:Fe-S cluster assembly protein SufD [Camelimonas abortus]|uniref:Fe-S cluster assembly protein SufD n=1 Tax=Camelimonas abortus TaxID=1017184 RepID=A0ABV7LHH0_9HYPH
MSADVTRLRTAAETALLERFGAVASALPGDGETSRRRQEAIAAFAATGLPTRRVEEFHYTDLRSLLREAAAPAPRPDVAAAAAALAARRAFPATLAIPTVDFVNGYLAAPLPAVPGVRIVALAEALASGDPLTARIGELELARANPLVALNTAFMAEGVVIHVTKEAGDAAVQLRFVNDADAPFMSAPRVLVAVDDGASLDLVETHAGVNGVAYQVNAVVEILAGDGARVNHTRVNAEGDAAQAFSTLAAKAGAGVNFTTFGLTSGAGLSRHQIFIGCAGEGSELKIGGAAMLRGRQFGDVTLTLDHAVPACVSRELFRTALDDEATGVFQGKIIVRPHAQKTDGRMMSAALLLAENAAMNNKPELEIFADDVQCAHGATCGQLDDDLLFYLMARGLPRREAEALVVEAFLAEPLEFVAREDVRDGLVALVQGWLAQRA